MRGVEESDNLPTFVLNKNKISNLLNSYSQTSMARTSLGPWKFVREKGSLSQ